MTGMISKTEAAIAPGSRPDLDAAASIAAARERGRLARPRGEAMYRNPYPRTPAHWSEWVAWRLGWTKGEAPQPIEEVPIDLVRNRDGVEVSVYSQDRGNVYLRQHVTIDHAEAADTARKVARVRDVLGDLYERGEITQDELRAGRKFQASFHTAQLEPTRIVDLAWSVDGGTGDNVADAVVEARNLIAAMMRALGGHGTRKSAAAWYCLGCGESVGGFANRVRMGQARRMNDSVAKGVLLCALEGIVGVTLESQLTGS